MHKMKIALVAHDNKKDDLLDWVQANQQLLSRHHLYATGTTGKLISDLLEIKVVRFKSGPLGGDQQIGAAIANGEIDFLIFFWDPLEALSHDTDIKALLRIAVVWNIPVACNRASADYLITSSLIEGDYQRMIPDYSQYLNRKVGSLEEIEKHKKT